MSGYMASARIVRASPRLARGEGNAWGRPPSRPSLSGATTVIETLRGEPIEAVGADDGRLAAIRERWAQLTFYLFDANAWR